MIQRGGIVVNMVMDVLAVCVGGNKKGIFALRPAHRRFIADTVGVLRGNLSGLESLPDLITQHIGIPALLPARDGPVLCFAQKELRIGGHVVAGIGRNQLAALRLIRVLSVFKPILQRLRDSLSLADFVLFKIGRCRRQPSLHNIRKRYRLQY